MRRMIVRSPSTKLSPPSDSIVTLQRDTLIQCEFFCRRTATFDANEPRLRGGRLECCGIERMALQQFVEFGAIALDELGCV